MPQTYDMSFEFGGLPLPAAEMRLKCCGTQVQVLDCKGVTPAVYCSANNAAVPSGILESDSVAGTGPDTVSGAAGAGVASVGVAGVAGVALAGARLPVSGPAGGRRPVPRPRAGGAANLNFKFTVAASSS